MIFLTLTVNSPSYFSFNAIMAIIITPQNNAPLFNPALELREHIYSYVFNPDGQKEVLWVLLLQLKNQPHHCKLKIIHSGSFTMRSAPFFSAEQSASLLATTAETLSP